MVTRDPLAILKTADMFEHLQRRGPFLRCRPDRQANGFLMVCLSARVTGHGGAALALSRAWHGQGLPFQRECRGPRVRVPLAPHEVAGQSDVDLYEDRLGPSPGAIGSAPPIGGEPPRGRSGLCGNSVSTDCRMVKRPPTVGDHGEAYARTRPSIAARREAPPGPVIRVTIFSPAGGHRR